MATALHTDLPIGEIHIPHQWEYANAAARLAATGFVLEDRYKLAIQLDSITLWMLTNHSPITWTQITAEDPGNVTALKLPAIKASAGTIYPGQPLYLLGLNLDGNALVEVADADDPAKMPAVGLAEDTFTDSVPGHGVFIGPIYGQETAAWAPGTLLYVSSTPGALTATRPTGVATYVQPVAVVMVQAAAPNGIIAATAQGYYWWPNLTEGYIPIGQAGNGLPTFRLFAHGHTGAGDGGILAANERGVEQSKVIYFGKHGNDANPGTFVEVAKLTLGGALTAAAALSPSQSNPISVVCHDGGVYQENVSIPSFVNVHAPNASIMGTVALGDDCSLDISGVIYTGGADAITKSSGTTAAALHTKVVNCLAANGNGIVCTAGAIEIDADVIVVQNGTAIGAATSQRINGHVGEILVNGTGKAIALTASGGKVNMTFERIYAPSGTGVDVVNGAEARLIGSRIDANVAWNIAAGGTFYAYIGAKTGTEVNAGTIHADIAGFARRYQYAESEADSDTTTQYPTWVNKVTLTMPANTPAGTYQIDWHFTFGFESYSMDGARGQVIVDDVTQLQEYKLVPTTTNLDYRGPVSGFKEITLTAGAHTIKINYCSAVNAKAMRIRNARIKVERMG